MIATVIFNVTVIISPMAHFSPSLCIETEGIGSLFPFLQSVEMLMANINSIQQKAKLARVRNCPDITILNFLFGRCLFICSSFCPFIFLTFFLFVFFCLCVFFLHFCLFIFLSFCLYITLIKCLKGLESQKLLFVSKF